MRANIIGYLFKFFGIFSIILLIFGIIWLRSNILNLEYQISALEKKKLYLMKEHKVVLAEKARLLALERFENSQERGFVFPDRVRVVYVKEPVIKEPYRVLHSRRY
jgi:hypothetical protein